MATCTTRGLRKPNNVPVHQHGRGAGSAWKFWAQEHVGAIKSGLTLLPTLNLTFDVILAYAGQTLVPAYMSASYTWSDYPTSA